MNFSGHVSIDSCNGAHPNRFPLQSLVMEDLTKVKPGLAKHVREKWMNQPDADTKSKKS